MRGRRLAFASVVALVVAADESAFALEARETHNQLILDVPSTWVVVRRGEYVRAHPPNRQSFEVSLKGEDHGPWQDAEAEKALLDIVRLGGGREVQEVHVETHARRIDWGNFTGFEVFGTGKMSNDYDTTYAPAKFFALVLVNKTAPTKTFYAVGIGSPAGYATNEPPIYTALHTLRTY